MRDRKREIERARGGKGGREGGILDLIVREENRQRSESLSLLAISNGLMKGFSLGLSYLLFTH